jgi:hypothetical protein
MTIIGKTNTDYMIQATPEEVEFIIAWDKSQGSFGINSLNVGGVVDVATKYKGIINITQLENKIESAKGNMQKVLDELNAVDINK